MEKFVNNLKRQAEENPLLALAVVGAVVTATSRLLKVSVEVGNSRTWAKEVARRSMMTK